MATPPYYFPIYHDRDDPASLLISYFSRPGRRSLLNFRLLTTAVTPPPPLNLLLLTTGVASTLEKYIKERVCPQVNASRQCTGGGAAVAPTPAKSPQSHGRFVESTKTETSHF